MTVGLAVVSVLLGTALLGVLVGAILHRLGAQRPLPTAQPEGPRVQAAVFSSANVRRRKDLADAIESAMSDAVRQLLAQGVPITNSSAIRAAMMDARRRVLQRHL